MGRDNATNWMFLLGMMSLGVGCTSGENDDRTTLGPAMTSAPGGGGNDGTAGDDDDDDDGGGGAATTGPLPGTSGPSSAGDDAPPADAGDDGLDTGYATLGGYGTYGDSYGMVDCSMPPPTSGPPSPQCQQYGTNLDNCFPGEITPECLNYYTAFCQYDLEYAAMAGGACGMAIEDFWACLSALSCEQLQSKSVCEAQLTALDTACGAGAPPSDPNRRRAVER
mgnify:CR=1 FL=1